jgi:hypothetical protein
MGGNEDTCWRCGTPWAASPMPQPGAPDVHHYQAVHSPSAAST